MCKDVLPRKRLANLPNKTFRRSFPISSILVTSFKDDDDDSFVFVATLKYNLVSFLFFSAAFLRTVSAIIRL